MLTIILVIIILFIIAKIRYKKWFVVEPIFNYFVITTMGIIIGCMIALTLPVKSEYQYSHKIEIVSLRDNNVLNGTFGLMAGSITTNNRYCFYYKNDTNRYEYSSISANNTQIELSDDNSAFIKVYVDTRTESAMNLFSLGRTREPQYILSIPSKSIITDYVLDGQ